MNTKQKTNWWIDLVLFAGFIVTFFMDLTGMELHQWIGILTGILAAYHLLAHLDWVTTITKRIFTKAPGRARAYYFLAGLLLAEFSLIVLTGLVLSTWLNLPLTNYTAWLNIHITFSIAALMTVLLKLILYWRWIAKIARSIFARPAAAPSGNLAVQSVKVRSGQVGRREFLKVIGIAGAASVLALSNASKALAETISENREVASVDNTNSSGSAFGTETQSATEAAITQETPAAETAIPTQETAQNSTEAVVQSSDSSAFSGSCTVRCHKGCSYPGHCRKYTDFNDNGLCDLGECM